MSGLERIIEHISKDAQAEVDSKLEKARSDVARLRQEAKDNLAKDIKALLAEREKTAFGIQERIYTAAKIDVNKKALALKREYLNKVLASTLEALKGMSDEKIVRFLTATIVKVIQTGREELILNAADRERIGQLLCERVNEVLAKAQKEASVTLSPDVRSMAGGVIVKNGKKEYVMSYEVLIEQASSQVEQEVCAKLFPRLDHYLEDLKV